MWGGKKCSIYGCLEYATNGKSFFRMPKDIYLLKKWILASRRADLLDLLKEKDVMYFNKTYSVCSDHFEESCLRDKNLPSRGVHPGSVPTLKLCIDLPKKEILLHRNTRIMSRRTFNKLKRELDQMEYKPTYKCIIIRDPKENNEQKDKSESDQRINVKENIVPDLNNTVINTNIVDKSNNRNMNIVSESSNTIVNTNNLLELDKDFQITRLRESLNQELDKAKEVIKELKKNLRSKNKLICRLNHKCMLYRSAIKAYKDQSHEFAIQIEKLNKYKRDLEKHAAMQIKKLNNYKTQLEKYSTKQLNRLNRYKTQLQTKAQKQSQKLKLKSGRRVKRCKKLVKDNIIQTIDVSGNPLCEFDQYNIPTENFNSQPDGLNQCKKQVKRRKKQVENDFMIQPINQTTGISESEFSEFDQYNTIPSHNIVDKPIGLCQGKKQVKPRKKQVKAKSEIKPIKSNQFISLDQFHIMPMENIAIETNGLRKCKMQTKVKSVTQPTDLNQGMVISDGLQFDGLDQCDIMPMDTFTTQAIGLNQYENQESHNSVIQHTNFNQEMVVSESQSTELDKCNTKPSITINSQPNELKQLKGIETQIISLKNFNISTPKPIKLKDIKVISPVKMKDIKVLSAVRTDRLKKIKVTSPIQSSNVKKVNLTYANKVGVKKQVNSTSVKQLTNVKQVNIVTQADGSKEYVVSMNNSLGKPCGLKKLRVISATEMKELMRQKQLNNSPKKTITPKIVKVESVNKASLRNQFEKHLDNFNAPTSELQHENQSDNSVTHHNQYRLTQNSVTQPNGIIKYEIRVDNSVIQPNVFNQVNKSVTQTGAVIKYEVELNDRANQINNFGDSATQLDTSSTHNSDNSVTDLSNNTFNTGVINFNEDRKDFVCGDVYHSIIL